MDQFRNQDQDGEKKFPHTFFAFGAIIAINLLFWLGGALLYLSFHASRQSADLLLIQALSEVFFLLVPALLLMRAYPPGLRAFFRVDNPDIRIKHFVVAGLGVILIEFFSGGWVVVQSAILPTDVAAWVAEQSKQMSDMLVNLVGDKSGFSFIRSVAVIALIPAIVEELVFRGLMQRSLEESMPSAVAITNSSILFAVIHLNPGQFIPMVLIGVILGSLAYQSRSLLPSMSMHFLNNLLAVISMFSTNWSAWEDKLTLDLAPAIAISASSLAAIIFCLFWIRRKRST